MVVELKQSINGDLGQGDAESGKHQMSMGICRVLHLGQRDQLDT